MPTLTVSACAAPSDTMPAASMPAANLAKDFMENSLCLVAVP
jgi:hypothetical protein